MIYFTEIQMKYFLVVFFLFSTFCYSQKEYKFDYLIEYDFTLYKDSVKIKNRPFRKEDKTIKKYYLTNSKNNDFTAIITEQDSLNYEMIFKDENGIYINLTFLKSDLNKAKLINIECKHVNRFSNPYKYQIKNYNFIILSDTIFNGKSYSQYMLASIKTKRVKRKKIGTEFFIIDKKTRFHLPILRFSTAYEEWKSNKNLPNGIFFERYFIDYYGDLDWREKLVGFWKIDKKIIIQEDCDYTEK